MALSTSIKHPQPGSAGENQGIRPFSCLHELFAYYRRTAPRRKAILAPGHAPLTHGALWSRMRDAVRELRRCGIGRSDRVAVVLPNGAEAALALISVAAGAVCVPLSPNFTGDECRRYFGDLRLSALVAGPDVDPAIRGAAHALGIPIIALLPRPDRGAGAFSLMGSTQRRPVTDGPSGGGDDAFILLTSGTTSRPKMVPVTHASVCLSAYNAAAALALGPRDRLLSLLPLSHAHGLISGVLAALAAGSSVVCTPGFNAAAFFGWLAEFRPTWYTAVPAIHRALIATTGRHKPDRCSLRLIRSASATLPPNVLGELESLFGVPVIETYGMTEAASQIAANPLGRRKAGSVGLPAGAEIAIMDGEGRRLPPGERGEIALRGPTITRGYDNDPAANETAFRNGWFRTGDVGYVDSDGYLFIVGRLKDIINRGGQKVAPTEVEEILLSHPDVVDAAVFSISHRRLDEDVAAAVVLREDAKISPHALRQYARERLARFKVPGLIRIVPAITKSHSGKVQRSGLAEALGIAGRRVQAQSGCKTLPPRSELERQLAETWATLLEIGRIGVDEDVYALGADSLTVTQMISRLRAQYGVELSVRDLFDAPTVAELAAHLGSLQVSGAVDPLSVRDAPSDERGVRLSFQQQRIYLLNRLDSTGCNYHVVEVARLSGPLDVEALEASLAGIIERHEVLRSTFAERQGEPVQMARPAARLRLECLQIRSGPKRKMQAAIEWQAKEFFRQPFEVEKEPPIKTRLLQLGKDDHVLVLKLHHLVTDGWSQQLFWEELGALYAARLKGTPAGLPPLNFQYRHFAEWQRAWLATRTAQEQLSYWRAQLQGLRELPLRTDKPRPKMWTGRGARHPLKLSRALSRDIKALCRRHRVTLFMTLLAAFQCLLYRYTGHEDVAVGSLIANRNRIEFERLIGMFANTIVLRTDLSGDPSFSELLLRVRQVTFDAHRNQDLPIEEILQAVQPARSPDRNPLFQVMVVLQNVSSRAAALPGLSVRFVDVDPGIARFDLMLELVDADEGLVGWIEYCTDLFESATIGRMVAHLRRLLEAIVANPEERISRLPLLTEDEIRRVLVDWNDTHTTFCRRGTPFEQFARQSERAPNAVAVSTGQARLTYRELAFRVSAIADRLSESGVSPDVVVVLLAERDVDLLAAMLAVQRAGGAFLPLDPMLPTARLAHILQHSRTPLVLAGEVFVAGLEAALSLGPARQLPRVLTLEELPEVMLRSSPRPVRPAPSSLAYVMYTSGSTGDPKGAMIEQRGLLNHLLSKISDLGLSASDVIAQTAPQSFDISVWQFLAALMVGGRVHICDDEQVRDPALLAEEIRREGVTVLEVVPALLRAILDRVPTEPSLAALSRLRWLICTGEAPAPELCREWLRQFPGVPLINAYGPAECSDDVAMHCVRTPPPASVTAVPIGRPIANMRLYVLDRHLQPLPIGVVGELCVGGVGVGRGYLNDSKQTERSFLSDPFSDRRGARLYRTGDLARWCADGTIEFVGRADHQVKIRGYRIELEEIEHVLLDHPDVQAAVVLARDDLDGVAGLIAHLVAADCREPGVKKLREFLKSRLPNYMIPRGFIFLDRMPLTAHGKVDRPALMAIHQGLRVADSEFVAPRDSTERVLAGIWSDLLRVEKISVLDNFFDLGGHSLLATRVLGRVASAVGVSLPLRALFEAPTIAGLARRIDRERELQVNERALDIARVEVNGHQPVSISQEHVLRIERNLPDFPQFNLPFTYRLQGPLNVPALERSLAELLLRHDALRTGFAWADEQAIARIMPAPAVSPPLVVEDLTIEAPARKNRAMTLLLKKAELRAEQEAWTSFDLTCAPLFRVRLLRLGTNDHVLLLILHHVIVDGWSIDILLEELSEIYASFVAGCDPQLPTPALRFVDFARWQRRWATTRAAARQFAYWKEQLREPLPIFPEGGDSRRRLLSRVSHEPVHVPSELLARLSALSRSQSCTQFMTLLTGFKALLLIRSGRNDICVATAMANRAHVKTERVIGPFENTTIIRTRIDADLSFEEALSRVRGSVLEAFARQDLPFEILAARLAGEGCLDPASIIQVSFVIQNAFRTPLKLPGIAVRSFGSIHREGQPVLPIDRTWLTVMLKETPSGIIGSFNFKNEEFEREKLQQWVADFRTILANAVDNPRTLLARLADG